MNLTKIGLKVQCIHNMTDKIKLHSDTPFAGKQKPDQAAPEQEEFDTKYKMHKRQITTFHFK